MRRVLGVGGDCGFGVGDISGGGSCGRTVNVWPGHAPLEDAHGVVAAGQVQCGPVPDRVFGRGVAAAVPQNGADGGGGCDEDQDKKGDSEDFHVSMVLPRKHQKKWQKCLKSSNFCHTGDMLKTVAIIAVPNFSIFEFGTAFEVFGIDRSDRGTGVPQFDFRVCTPVPGEVPLKSGLTMNVGLGLEAAADADLVIMAPYGREEDVPESVLDALRAAHSRGAWVMSICSGAFALARAGLLDGRRCTTHWHYSEELAAQYPKVLVDENVLYVEDGTDHHQRGNGGGH